MVVTMSDLKRYTVLAADGGVGPVRDALFDDRSWTLRYLIVDAGSWLSSRMVLISPTAVRLVDRVRKRLQVALTRRRIENSPPVDPDAPISRLIERQLARYYRWPDYWTTGSRDRLQGPANAADEVERGEPHLRSARGIMGYAITAEDGAVGSIHDTIINPQDWTMRYLVIDTGTWLPGRKVMLSPLWVSRVDWPGRTAWVDLTRAQIEQGPEFDSSQSLEQGMASVAPSRTGPNPLGKR